MVEKLKEKTIELIEETQDVSLVDLIYRLLLKSIDRELTPEKLESEVE